MKSKKRPTSKRRRVKPAACAPTHTCTNPAPMFQVSKPIVLDTEPSSFVYKHSGVNVVTQRLNPGDWMATYPGFSARGICESDALHALAREIAYASTSVRALATDRSAYIVRGQ